MEKSECLLYLQNIIWCIFTLIKSVSFNFWLTAKTFECFRLLLIEMVISLMLLKSVILAFQILESSKHVLLFELPRLLYIIVLVVQFLVANDILINDTNT